MLPVQPSVTEVALDKAIDIVKDAFTVAGERDIYTGDKVEVWVIKKEGIERSEFDLKKD